MQVFNQFHIYQIGNIVVDFIAQGSMPLSAPYSISNKKLLMSNSFVFGIPAQSQPKTTTLSGILISRNLWDINQMVARLEFLAQEEQDIVGYIYLDEANIDQYEESTDPYNLGLLWFTTRGFITNIDQQNSEQNITATVGVTLKQPWEPLNRLYWEYRGNGFPMSKLYDYTTEFSIDPLSYQKPYVDVDSVVNYSSHGLKWHKRQYSNGSNTWSIDYQPLFMEYMINNLRAGFPSIGQKGLISHNNEGSFYVDESLFNTSPRSIYWIELLSSYTGVVTFNITNQINGSTSNTSIDFTELDADLAAAGLTGIQDGDVLYFGDTHVKPGFIVRGTTILNTVFPPITYSGRFPGQILPGMSSYSYTCTVDEAPLNYFHYYKRV